MSTKELDLMKQLEATKKEARTLERRIRWRSARITECKTAEEFNEMNSDIEKDIEAQRETAAELLQLRAAVVSLCGLPGSGTIHV